MKKLVFTVMFASASFAAMADNEIVTTATTLQKDAVVEAAADTANWTFPGSMGVNANQAYFNDYSTEGSGASISLDAFLNLNANYKKGKHLWENSLSAKFGMIYSTEFTGDDKIRKNMDELILNTKYGYKISKTWYVSAFANMETQFAKGYEYNSDVNGQDSASMISNFFAPGYVKVSLGMEYIPNQYFSAFISPITARFTVCRLDELGDKYGMELVEEAVDAVTDEDGKILQEAVAAEYKHLRSELGAYAKLKSDFDITKQLHFFSTLEGFYAYNKAVETMTDDYVDWYGANGSWNDAKTVYTLNDGAEYSAEQLEKIHGWYIKWKVEFLLKLSKYVNLSFKTQLKYDNAEKKSVEGENYGLPKAKMQFWETTSLGVSYSF